MNKDNIYKYIKMEKYWNLMFENYIFLEQGLKVKYKNKLKNMKKKEYPILIYNTLSMASSLSIEKKENVSDILNTLYILINDKYQFIEAYAPLVRDLTEQGLLEEENTEKENKNINISDIKTRFIYVLYINSVGGDVYVLLELLNLIKLLKQKENITIITVNTGVSMSAAGILHLLGDIKVGFKDSLLMFHKGSYSFKGATSSEVKTYINNLEQGLLQNEEKIILSKLNKHQKDLYEKGLDIVLLSDEAKKLGFYDIII